MMLGQLLETQSRNPDSFSDSTKSFSAIAARLSIGKIALSGFGTNFFNSRGDKSPGKEEAFTWLPIPALTRISRSTSGCTGGLSPRPSSFCIIPKTLRESASAGWKLGKSDHAIQHASNWGKFPISALRSEPPTATYRERHPKRLLAPSDQLTLTRGENLSGLADGSCPFAELLLEGASFVWSTSGTPYSSTFIAVRHLFDL
jgi:hypothetical protein